jgi:hypothetical protein
VTLRARWLTLRAHWVTLRAHWVTLRARWVTLRARWVTLRARWVTLRARWVTLRARWVMLISQAGGVCGLLINPIDVVKSRMMCPPCATADGEVACAVQPAAARSMWQQATLLLEEDGMAGLMRGVVSFPE